MQISPYLPMESALPHYFKKMTRALREIRIVGWDSNHYAVRLNFHFLLDKLKKDPARIQHCVRQVLKFLYSRRVSYSSKTASNRRSKIEGEHKIDLDAGKPQRYFGTRALSQIWYITINNLVLISLRVCDSYETAERTIWSLFFRFK
jgi:hypothetical protein